MSVHENGKNPNEELVAQYRDGLRARGIPWNFDEVHIDFGPLTPTQENGLCAVIAEIVQMMQQPAELKV